jgi:hypothetical protein
MSTSSAEGIPLDLNDLFSSPDDPRIEGTLNDCHARAEAFAARFRSVMEHPETLTAPLFRNSMAVSAASKATQLRHSADHRRDRFGLRRDAGF